MRGWAVSTPFVSLTKRIVIAILTKKRIFAFHVLRFLLEIEAKRETGVSPVRSRHCNGGVPPKMPLRSSLGKADGAENPESGDLHEMISVDGASIKEARDTVNSDCSFWLQSFFCLPLRYHL